MAAGDKIVQCLGLPLDELTLFKMTIVKDASDNFYLNIYYSDCADCETLIPAIGCISNDKLKQLMRNLIVEDECGNPAWNLTGNICAACP